MNCQQRVAHVVALVVKHGLCVPSSCSRTGPETIGGIMRTSAIAAMCSVFLAASAYAGSDDEQHVVLVSVPATAAGGFGNVAGVTSNQLNGLPLVAAYTANGPGVIRVTASGEWTIWFGGQMLGADGYLETPTEVQTPLVEATGTWGVSEMSGALIGAFVPASVVSMPGFSPVDGSKGLAAIGISPSSLIYIGRRSFIQISGPGTLFLGINDADAVVWDNSGSLTVRVAGP